MSKTNNQDLYLKGLAICMGERLFEIYQFSHQLLASAASHIQADKKRLDMNVSELANKSAGWSEGN